MVLLKKIIKNEQQLLNNVLNEQLFKKTIYNTYSKIVSFLDSISLPVIKNDFFNLCENDLTEDDLFKKYEK